MTTEPTSSCKDCYGKGYASVFVEKTMIGDFDTVTTKKKFIANKKCRRCDGTGKMLCDLSPDVPQCPTCNLSMTWNITFGIWKCSECRTTKTSEEKTSHTAAKSSCRSSEGKVSPSTPPEQGEMERKFTNEEVKAHFEMTERAIRRMESEAEEGSPFSAQRDIQLLKSQLEAQSKLLSEASREALESRVKIRRLEGENGEMVTEAARSLRVMLKNNMENEEYFGMFGQCDVERFVTDFVSSLSL